MIAIKDMEMPSCCGECNLTCCKGYDEPWNYCCSITLTNINLDNTERPSDCPLVEIEERKVGKWIKEEDTLEWDGHSYQCSICGRSIHLDTEVEGLEDYPYCHCGAEMEGSENENNIN